MTEMPDVFEETDRRARKDHVCVECRQTIPKGAKYFEISGLWEGEWARFKQCVDCRNLFIEAASRHEGPPDTMPSYGDLREYLLDTDEYLRLGLPGGEQLKREA